MTLDTDIARLSRVPLFSALTTGGLRLLAFAAEPQTFKDGDILFRRGEASDATYLIVSGSVELYADDEAAGAGRVVGPGTLLGEQVLLAPSLRPVTARAIAPTSTLRITRGMVKRVLREYPAAAAVIRQAWARRLHQRLTED